MKQDVSDMLQKLIRTQEAKDARQEVVSESQGELTILGAPLSAKVINIMSSI